MTDKTFFVSEDGSSASTATEPRWGYTERRCADCGKSWGPTRCSNPTCNSMGFTDTYREPIPFMTGIREKIAPKAKPPRATGAQVERLRARRAQAQDLLDSLRIDEDELIAAVRAGVEELIPAQGYVHRSLAIIGSDRSPRNIDGLGLGLESLADFLGAEIKTLEEAK